MTAARSTSPIQLLADQHRTACCENVSTNDLLTLFCQDPWFDRKINRTAQRLAARHGLLSGAYEDIRQEALVRFSQTLHRKPGLGFRSGRGSYEAFLSRLILRCCQHGVRRLQNKIDDRESLSESKLQIDDRNRLDASIDVLQLLAEVSQPQQTAMRMKLEGWSAKEIARFNGKSKRTVTRWIQQAIEQMKARSQATHPADPESTDLPR